LQEDALQKAGCEKIFRDITSGAADSRKGLSETIEYARVECLTAGSTTWLSVSSSALVRNYHTLLGKSDPAPRQGRCAFAAGQGRLPLDKSQANRQRATPGWLIG
jgi:hypothetical protein